MVAEDRNATRIARITLLTFAAIIAAWIAAWMVKVQLDGTVLWLATSAGGFVY